VSQLKYAQEIEQGYIRRIEAILQPIVGASNVRAQVAADIDFSVVERTDEKYKPNQDRAQAAVRSQQSSESAQQGGNAAGRRAGRAVEPAAEPERTDPGPRAINAGHAASRGTPRPGARARCHDRRHDGGPRARAARARTPRPTTNSTARSATCSKPPAA
jgi:flagellar M-ring protein FliF